MSWFRLLVERSNRLPDNYLVFDVETTGLSVNNDLITQVGYCFVNNKQILASGSTLLDWTSCSEIDQDWLRNKLIDTKRRMAELGKPYHITYEKLRDLGQQPIHTLDCYFSALEEAQQRSDALVSHNGLGFDIPMLRAHFKRWLNKKLTIQPNQLYDTGIMEKLCQMNLLPNSGEDIGTFLVRLQYKRMNGIYWSLDKHCIPKYKLNEKYQLDADKAHDAGYDCVITYHLFETFRELSNTDKQHDQKTVCADDQPGRPGCQSAGTV